MTNAYDENLGKIQGELERLLPLLLGDDEVSPEAYHAAQHARDWMTLCEEELKKTVWWNTVCPNCKHQFLLEQSPIACPACGYATDNWLGDEEIEERLDAARAGL